MKLKRVVLALLVCFVGFNSVVRAEEQVVQQEASAEYQLDTIENQEASLPSEDSEENFELEDMLDDEAIDLEQEPNSPIEE
jgi:hypothetical protein